MLNIEMSHEEFIKTHFEQQPLLFSQVLEQHPIQWRDLDAILNSVEPDERHLQMFLGGPLSPLNYLDSVNELGRQHSRINKDRFYKLLHNGATLVLNRVEDFSVAAKKLCATVGRFTQQPTSSNAYVSFSGDGTFGQHWDTHDVFAIQLQGRKRWKLFSPTLPLPTSQQTSRLSKHECPKSPQFEFLLEAGDMLYIPRGWWHEVTPLDEASLHLSVGTYPPTLFDYLMWVCNGKLPQLQTARTGIADFDSLRSTATQNSIKDLLKMIAEEALAEKTMHGFMNQMRNQERLTSEFLTEFMVDRVDKSLNVECQLSFNSCYALEVSTSEILVNGGKLRLGEVGEEVVGLLSRRSTMNWSELCSALPHHSDLVLRDTVLNLNRYDVINIANLSPV